MSANDSPTHPIDTTSASTDNTMAAVMAATRLPPTISAIQTSDLQTSPPQSGTSSPTPLLAKESRSPLSMDLSDVPPLSSPAPPSNTLLITRLEDPKIFHPASLATIRQHINSIAPLNSFSPLKSMARLIVSFYDEQSAINVRREIDGTAFSATAVAKCYFGESTPIGDEKKYLERPDAGRLFFISPPPSPPVGWEMKMEDPPNKEVHADDLAAKLAKLTGKLESNPMDTSITSDDRSLQFTADEMGQLKGVSQKHKRALSAVLEDLNEGGSPPKMRSRSSTLIYDPKVHGDSPGLPAVMLETEDDSDVELDSKVKPPMAHTSRPPVELME
jgi:hypothetical protein